MFYIIIMRKNFEMVKIYCGPFNQRILLLVKICIINLLVKKSKCEQFSQRILLLVKICMRAVRLGNIIIDKNLYGLLFIRTLVSTFIYHQRINILEGKTLHFIFIHTYIPCSIRKKITTYFCPTTHVTFFIFL
jgi:hypothetical protein